MMKYLLIAAGVAILILSGIVSFQYKAIEALNQDIATERANVVTLKATIKEQNETILLVEKQRAADQVKMDWLREQKLQAVEEQKNAEASINSYRKRLDKAAIAKPELVGRIATRATGRVMRSFFKASGGREEGPTAKDLSPTPSVSDPPDARGDNGNNPTKSRQVVD